MVSLKPLLDNQVTPVFVHLMDELKGLLQYAFKTENRLTLPVSAPGSAGMETTFVNLIQPGDKVVVCQNGVFGGRMKENVERAGGVAILIEDPWGRAVDPNKLEDALKNNSDVKIVAFVHAETSTGALSDAKTLCAIAQKYQKSSRLRGRVRARLTAQDGAVLARVTASSMSFCNSPLWYSSRVMSQPPTSSPSM